MATQLSKADQIRKLLHLSNKEIAERIGCLDAYVRAVRQRTSDSGNPITDAACRNWVLENRALLRVRWRERYANEPSFRERHLQASKSAYYSAKRRAEARAS